MVDDRRIILKNGDAIFLACFDAEEIRSAEVADERRRKQKDMVITRESETSTRIVSINSVAAIAFVLIVVFDYFVFATGSTAVYSRIAEVFNEPTITARWVFGVINVIATSIFFGFTAYTNVTSLDMVKVSAGVKTHKKLAKVCYLSGLATTASLIGYGVCADTGKGVHLFGIAVVQAYMLYMSMGTAMMKQLVSHRIWSYCLSGFQLKIALKAHVSLIAGVIGADGSSALVTFCAGDLTSIIAIAYLVYQEKKLDQVMQSTTPTFQISQTCYQEQQQTSNSTAVPNGIQLVVAKTVVRMLLIGHFTISIGLTFFAQQEAQMLFSSVENVAAIAYFFAVIGPMVAKVKGEKKMKKLRMKKEKENKVKGEHEKET